MAETGWPLIPREVLPAPIPAVRSALRPLPPVADAHADPGRQLSIFGAETTEPSPADLAGLLAGPGRLDRMGGTARVSVRVDAAWRVHVLVGELVRRGLVVTWLPVETAQITNQPLDGTAHQSPTADTTPDQPTRPTGPAEAEQPDLDPAEIDPAEYDEEPASAVIGGAARSPEAPTSPDRASSDPDPDSSDPDDAPRGGDVAFEIRTAYSSRLNGLARSWPAAADHLFLSGPRLRLWVAAAGRPLAGGYALGLDPSEDPAMADAALVRAGLAGTVSDDGRYYLILGRKRLTRLAELVGERPKQAPDGLWPGSVAA